MRTGWHGSDVMLGHMKEGGYRAHERPRESGSFRMSAMTLFWYLAPMPAMAAIRLAQ